MRFRYWRDPLFLLGCFLYVVNRWELKPHIHSAFLQGQFNDLLLIPCALPFTLWMQRKLHLRKHDRPPTLLEILTHLILWSLLFEIVGPHLLPVTGDFKDILAYTTGALIAAGWWQYTLNRPSSHEL